MTANQSLKLDPLPRLHSLVCSPLRPSTCHNPPIPPWQTIPRPTTALVSPPALQHSATNLNVCICVSVCRYYRVWSGLLFWWCLVTVFSRVCDFFVFFFVFERYLESGDQCIPPLPPPWGLYISKQFIESSVFFFFFFFSFFWYLECRFSFLVICWCCRYFLWFLYFFKDLFSCC